LRLSAACAPALVFFHDEFERHFFSLLLLAKYAALSCLKQKNQLSLSLCSFSLPIQSAFKDDGLEIVARQERNKNAFRFVGVFEVACATLGAFSTE
jgi:hypothetical protein